MQQSKATLFLDRIASEASAVFERVIAVERAGNQEHRIATIFEDRHDGEGAIFGVARALADAPGPCFVLAVDFALMTREVLSFLRSRFEVSNAYMLVPVWSGVPQVLCAGYRTCVAPAITESIAAGRYDLQGLLAETDAEIIDETILRSRFAGDPFMNVNTPEQLAMVERMK